MLASLRAVRGRRGQLAHTVRISLAEKGILYTVYLTSADDLDRQVVKSEFATLTIPELELSIPPKRGQLTTVEGIVSDTLRDLSMDQPLRQHAQPEAYAKIEEICTRLRSILGEDKEGEKVAKEQREFAPFSLRLDDPSGNSFIEFTGAVGQLGAADNKWTKRDYARSVEQNSVLGLAAPPKAPTTVERDEGGGFSKKQGETEFDNEEVFAFDGTCSSCSAPLQTLMKQVTIPYFKVRRAPLTRPLVCPAHGLTVCSRDDRTSSSCRPTATRVAIATTKSSRALPFRQRGAS
jgi:zinc finger protein